MDGKDFFEFVFSLLTESGHVATSDPVYINHSSKEMLYVDSTADVMVTSMDRQLLLEVDNISLLQELNWSGQESGVDENVQIYSMEVNSLVSCRSQDVARIHQLLCYYWSCTHSIVFFKSQNSFVISFADNLRSHILSDWYDFSEGGTIIEKLNIGIISLDSSNQYFEDFLFAVAREYYIYPISVEEASYGMIPIDYISNGLLLSLNSSKIDIKAMIRSNLRMYESQYGSDYIEPRHTGIEEYTDYKDVTDEIDRLSFELEVAKDDDGDYKQEDSVVHDDYFEDDEELFDPNITSEIFDDPVLMVKWLEQSQKKSDQQEHEKYRIEAQLQEQKQREDEQLEQKLLVAIHQEQERLEIEHSEKERIETERREQEQLHFARQIVDTVINELISRYPNKTNAPKSFEDLNLYNPDLSLATLEKWSQIGYGKSVISLLGQRGFLPSSLANHQDQFVIEHREQERLEAERQEKERLEAEHRENERLEAERREQERLEAERRERERLEAERREQERLETERRERERLEAERREQERLEAERRERERLEAERREQERLETERRERERLEAERRERERLEAERREQERLEAERRERERLEAERREQERLETERRERERLEAERRERECLEAERQERERLEAERRKQERLRKETQKKRQFDSAKIYLEVSDSDPYSRWLAENTSDEYIAEMYLAYAVIQKYANGRNLLSDSLLKTTDLRILWTLQDAIKSNKEFQKLGGNIRYFCDLAMRYYMRYLSEIDAERKRQEQERLETERQEQERLEAEHYTRLYELKIQHDTKIANLRAEILSIDGAIKQMKQREANLSILKFLEKRRLKDEIDNLQVKKDQLQSQLNKCNSEYDELCNEELIGYNLRLINNGF